MKFGKTNYSFKKFFNKLKKSANSSQEWGDNYTYDPATFEELGKTGALNLSAFSDISQLESGAYLDVAIYNNSLVV